MLLCKFSLQETKLGTVGRSEKRRVSGLGPGYKLQCIKISNIASKKPCFFTQKKILVDISKKGRSVGLQMPRAWSRRFFTVSYRANFGPKNLKKYIIKTGPWPIPVKKKPIKLSLTKLRRPNSP